MSSPDDDHIEPLNVANIDGMFVTTPGGDGRTALRCGYTA